MNYRDLNPQLRAALSAHQRTAARQASRWLDERIAAYLRDFERPVRCNSPHVVGPLQVLTPEGWKVSTRESPRGMYLP